MERGKTLKPNLSSITVLTLQLAAATLAGIAAFLLDIPGDWLLGPLLIGVLATLNPDKAQPLPPSLATAAQVIIALGTAASFSLSTLFQAAHYTLAMLMCIVLTGGLCLGKGYLLWRWAGIDIKTGFLGSIPGAGHSIVAMSEEMGADALAVAVFQYLRILLVLILIPLLAGYFFPVDSVSVNVPSVITHQFSLTEFSVNLALLTLLGALGVLGGRWLRLPQAVFIGPLLTGLLAFWFFPYPLYLPKLVLNIGLLLLGLSIGLKFNWQAAQKLIKAVLIELILVIILILGCLGVGYEFHWLTGVDLITALLGSTPGGLMAVMAATIQLGGDSGLVLGMQMSRMFLILLITPWLASFLLKTPQKVDEDFSE